ncbi:MAG TPA: long-chain fatty acid--CoA ligase [Candidatus Limnocylindrales bacterium]|nr:long-chain fatty acid--CoA ligase [Candidatus Limnocylindrales bacterium]
MILGQMLEETAERFPHHIAIKFGKQKITFKQLDEAVNRLSQALLKRDVQEGDKVGILLENKPEYIISYFAILKTGGVVVPLNTFLTGVELAYIMNDCQLKAIITSKKFLETLQPILPQVLSLKYTILMDDDSKEFLSLNRLMEAELPVSPGKKLNPENLAVLIYTSGTTGHPKGVMLSHKNLYSNIESCIRAFKFSHRDRFLLFLPLFHAFTFTVCVLAPIYGGARIILLESVKSLEEIKKSILWDRVTIFVGVPAVFNILAERKVPWIVKYLHAIRAFISGSAPLSAATIEKIEKKFGAPLLEGYGLSEASPVVSVNPLEGVRKVGSVGLPIPQVQVKIVDAEGNDLPVGQEGEIAVKGPNVMLGYYRLPEATQSVLRDGWLLTGDIGKLDEDGYLYILDRKKDMLLVRGINVYPREIEEVLLSHPQIVECAVIGVKDEQRGEVPKAFIVLKEGAALTEREIRRYCMEKLARYKIPRYIEFRKSLPKTPTGKILKRELR